MGGCTSSTATPSLSSLSASQQNSLMKSLSPALRQALNDCTDTSSLVLHCCHFTPAMILGLRLALAQQLQQQRPHTSIHALTIRHCFWNNLQTIQVLCDFIASLEQLQELTLERNTLQGGQQLQSHHLDLLVRAIRRAQRVHGPILHKTVVGNEFLAVDGDAALQALCSGTRALHVHYTAGTSLALHQQAHFLRRFLEFGLLSRTINNSTCQVQSLTLQGHGILNEERWHALARVLRTTTHSGNGCRTSTSTVRHLQIVDEAVVPAAITVLIALLDPTSPLETLDIGVCMFGDRIDHVQAHQWGDALARNNTLQVLRLRNLSWNDTLAVPTFLALRDNTTLRTLDVGTWVRSRDGPHTMEMLPRGYRALVDVLPHLSALQSLHLSAAFFFSFHTAEFVQAMKQAMLENTSIVNWLGGTKQGRRRYGPWHDALLYTAIPRNRAWHAAKWLLSTKPPLYVWHAALRHWLAEPQRHRSALFCIVKVLKVTPP